MERQKGMSKPGLLTAIAVFGFGLPLLAQVPARDHPAFEVVSVKRNPSAVGGFRVEIQPGGRLVASYVTLQLLVTDAYEIQSYQLANAPDWFAKDHFDITAVAASDLAFSGAMERSGGPTLIDLMMQSLFADRFKMIAHRETRQLPVYDLSLARRDGGLGPKLRPSASDCWQKPNSDCAFGGPPGGGHLAYQSVAISEVLPMLTRAVGRPVLDRTGLTGLFDIDLTWSPEPLPSTASSTTDTSNTSASIFTALQEQLGLKLDSKTEPVDVLVIDHVEHPTEN